MRSTTAILISMLLLLMCLAAVLQASGVAAAGAGDGVGGIMQIPSNDSLAHCPSTCRDVNFYYPFGTTAGCFRQGFEITCDNTTHPPRLLWGNSTTQILGTDGTDHYFAYASIGFNITRAPGTDTYERSWESPAKSFTIDSDNQFYVVGCDVEATLFDMDTNLTIGSCTSTCKGDRATMEKEQAAAGHCNGSGCCSIGLPDYMRGFQFTLARRGGIAARSDAMPSTVKVFLSDQHGRSQPMRRPRACPAVAQLVLLLTYNFFLSHSEISSGNLRLASGYCPDGPRPISAAADQYDFHMSDLYSSWINKSSIHTETTRNSGFLNFRWISSRI